WLDAGRAAHRAPEDDQRYTIEWKRPSRPSSGAAGPSGTWLLVHPGAGEPGEPGGPEHGAVRAALEACGAETVSVGVPADADRAEERRVGKECRPRGSPEHGASGATG